MCTAFWSHVYGTLAYMMSRMRWISSSPGAEDRDAEDLLVLRSHSEVHEAFGFFRLEHWGSFTSDANGVTRERRLHQRHSGRHWMLGSGSSFGVAQS